ncbi:MAG: glycosyltransferase [Flavobacteriaceae bacterium]|nr:glycosyltransferase [Flavobacteriaceae bacterium]
MDVKIKRFYLMSEVWVTVTQSQVFNWIKLINQKGIPTDCISITTKKSSKKDVEKIEESIEGNFIEIHNRKRLIVSDIFLTLNLLKHYLKSLSNYKKIIFQTRLTGAGLTFGVLSWLPRSKFIFEARAATNEERIYISEGEKVTLKMKIKNWFAETSERMVVTKSDKVFCVSKTLKDYYLKKYNLSEEKFSVFPGAADSELFFYDESLRNNIRNELDLNSNEILIVYSGRLEMKWEIPDKIISFFKDLHIKNPMFRLLLVTPDVTLANKLIKEQKLEDVTFVKKVELIDVNKYLNAADVGLLLREDIPMNNVASPTKFAEYLMSGLPVIISHGICDFAADVHKTKYGVVVSGLDEITSIEYDNLLKSLTIDRNQIATWGLECLSKESFIKKYVSILEEI